MRRRVFALGAAAALTVAPAAAAQRVLVMPGVTHEREVEFTTHPQVVLHVLR